MYFCQTFHVTATKLVAVPVGAYSERLIPRNTEHNSSRFTVFFAGSCLPLHGMEFILKAASLLQIDHDIVLEVMGFGEEWRRLQRSYAGSNIKFLSAHSYSDYLSMLGQADVALGIFGTTPKATRVIPCKVYDALVVGTPVITADTPAVRGLLEHGHNAILVPPGNPDALAQAIIALKQNPVWRKQLAQSGQRTYAQVGTPEVIGRQLRTICTKVLMS